MDNLTPPAPSRRDFLRQLSGGLGAAALTGSSLARAADSARARPNESDTPIPQDEQIGYALVGLGSLSTGQLAPAFESTNRCYLAGIVTGTPAKARVWQERYDIPDANVYDYETYDRIADNDEIDVVYIVLPNAMHAEYTIRGAEAGKHVLCEKPMATSSAACHQMIDACRSADRKLAIGYRLHFEPYNQALMRMGREAEFGPVKMMEASFAFPIGDPNQWRLDRTLAGGGPLMDVGIYAVNAARYVNGEEPVSVTAQSVKTDPEKFDEVEETLFWQLRFPNGAVAASSTSYNASVNRLYFSARGGWAELEPAYSYGGLSGRTHEGALDFADIDQFAAEMDAFARCIQEDRESRVPGEEGLRDLEVMEAIYEAAETGGSVEIG
mgnify:CR=1 FL=1